MAPAESLMMPAFEAPAFEAPAFEAPVFEAPAFETSASEAPVFEALGAAAPAEAFALLDAEPVSLAPKIVPITRISVRDAQIAALERFLRQTQARRLQLAAGSVA
jgi:hypothetical protein